jgi:hypothetical protein
VVGGVPMVVVDGGVVVVVVGGRVVGGAVVGGAVVGGAVVAVPPPQAWPLTVQAVGGLPLPL